jgi:hypothetical protein
VNVTSIRLTQPLLAGISMGVGATALTRVPAPQRLNFPGEVVMVGGVPADPHVALVAANTGTGIGVVESGLGAPAPVLHSDRMPAQGLLLLA